MSGARLFENLDLLVAESTVVIDRPKDSVHPRVPQAVYPVDYGYLDGTTSGDGGGIDVFRGSATGTGVTGFFVTADRIKRDVEIKVLVDCTEREAEQIRQLLCEVFGIGGLLVPR
ncbi:inorganic pyrophosphatase [Actinophytocola sediminis]